MLRAYGAEQRKKSSGNLNQWTNKHDDNLLADDGFVMSIPAKFKRAQLHTVIIILLFFTSAQTSLKGSFPVKQFPISLIK